MVKGFYKDLLFGIVIVLLLLGVCVSVDYADDSPINNINNSTYNINTSRINVANNTGVLEADDTGVSFTGKNSDKIHTIKKKAKQKSKIPIVTITSKPSCGCNYGYYYHTKSYIDYCPHCNNYNVLRNVHKWQARYEQELTCTCCGADYCGCCGKEKYSYSRVYLRSA